MKKFKISKDNIAAVLLYHRIGDPDGGVEPISDGLKVHPEIFEKTIKWFIERGYNFISLDTLHDLVAQKVNFKNNKNLCLTFDDGYKDNLYDLLPIAKKYNIPFAVYVAAYAPDGKLFTWWNTLEELLLKNNRLELSDGSIYSCRDIDEKWSAFWSLREKILELAKGAELEKTFKKLFSRYSFDLYRYSQQQYLSWSEVIILDKEPLCTIAAHSCTHLAMDVASLEVVNNEMIESLQILEKKLGHKIEHFAYPFGLYNEQILKLMKKYQKQIKTFTSTNFGYINQQTNLLTIPRIASIENLLFEQKMFNWNKYKGWRLIKGFIRLRLSSKTIKCELLKILNIKICDLRGHIGKCQFKFSIGEEL